MKNTRNLIWVRVFMFLAILYISGMIIGNEIFATHISKPVFTMEKTTFEPGMIVNISGWVNYNDEPTSDVLLLIRVLDTTDEKIFEQSVTSDSTGNFLTPFSVPKKAPEKYFIEVTSFCREEHRDICTKQVAVFPIIIKNPEVTSTKIPHWIKNTALWWSDGKITDIEFINGMQFLIKEEILVIPPTESKVTTSQIIPEWIKNNAGWWAKNQIEDNSFIQGIQFLIKEGIIRV